MKKREEIRKKGSKFSMRQNSKLVAKIHNRRHQEAICERCKNIQLLKSLF